jgi:hypothetical protein
MNTFVDQRVLDRIRAEYLEMPGMKLTTAQVRRLCGIDPSMCKAALDSLVQALFLCFRPAIDIGVALLTLLWLGVGRAEARKFQNNNRLREGKAAESIYLMNMLVQTLDQSQRR